MLAAQRRARTRQLLRLAQQHERQLQRKRDGGAEEEAAALEARHAVELQRTAVLYQQVNAMLVRFRLQQQRRDVLEQNARLGKVRDGAYGSPNRCTPGAVAKRCSHAAKSAQAGAFWAYNA
jgi:hypothetical protein